MADFTEEQQGIVNTLTGIGIDGQQATFLVSLNPTAGDIASLSAQTVLGNQMGAIQGILADRTPEQMVTALENAFPEMQSMVDLLKANPNLAESFHNAITQDPSMLPGLQEMAGREEGFNVDEFASMLDSDAKIDAAAQLLNRIAENPDDEFNFNFLNNFSNALITAANEPTPENQAAVREMAEQAGIDTSEVETEEAMALFTLMRENPHAFAEQAALLMGLDPASSPETTAALEAFAEIFSTLLGPYIDLIEYYYPGVADYATRLTNEWSGEGAPAADAAAEADGAAAEPTAVAELPVPNPGVSPTADTLSGLHAQGADIIDPDDVSTEVDAGETFGRAVDGDVNPEAVSANPVYAPIEPTVPANPQDTPGLGR